LGLQPISSELVSAIAASAQCGNPLLGVGKEDELLVFALATLARCPLAKRD
jgi:hypothetical protein